jgi:hypothetical protein
VLADTGVPPVREGAHSAPSVGAVPLSTGPALGEMTGQQEQQQQGFRC